jgi:membrane-bound lytic murein transglycosylase B
MSRWAALGLRLADGSPLPAGDTPAGLLLPAGAEGPAFLGGRMKGGAFGRSSSIGWR